MKQKNASNAAVNNSFISRLVYQIPRFRAVIILAAFLLVAVSFPGIFKLDITVDIAKFFLNDDPVIQNQEKFRKLFGNTDFVGVLVQSDDVFSKETLELIRLVGKRLSKEVPLAEEVVSLAELDPIQTEGLRLRFKGNSLVSTKREVNRIRASYSKNRLLQGVLFSKDHKQAWILLKLEKYPSADEWGGETTPLFNVGRKAYEIVVSIDSGNARLIPTGVPVYTYRKNSEMMSDLFRVLIIGSIVTLCVSIFILRSIQAVTGTLSVIIFSVLSVLGIQGWLGVSTDSAFIAVPILLTMGVSVGYTIHVFRFFSIRLHRTGKRKESAIYAVLQTGRPILFTAFTTIAALVSFLLVKIRPIQWVGITSSSCIFVAFVSSMALFPAILTLGRDRKASSESYNGRNTFDPVLRRFSDWVVRHGRVIIPVFLVITVVASYGITKLEIDLNAEKIMGTRLPHMKDQVMISHSDIAVNDSLDLVISMPSGSFRKATALIKLDILERRIQKLPLVKRVSSLTGIVREVNYIMHGKNPDYDKIPNDTRSLKFIYSLIKSRSPQMLTDWVNNRYSDTRVFIELSEFSSREINGIIAEVNQMLEELFPNRADHYMSGSAYQMAVMNKYITRGLIRSILFALLMITLLMAMVFKSIRSAIAAMVPNVFPVLIAGGIMGVAGIPLEFVTMTVAPMIMGLAVDDTIHLVYHITKDVKKKGNYATGIQHTFMHVGIAITETTVILCLTFLVFTVSQVASIINMGLIACSGMLSAYLADIFVTPVLIRWMKPSGLKKHIK